MKKFLLQILIFFAIVVTIDVLCGFTFDFIQTHAKGGKTKRTNDLALNTQYDIIIMGSSRARHHYDTPLLSDSLNCLVYNAGYDGNGILLAYGFSKLIVERYKPKAIVYDVTPKFDIYQNNEDNNDIRYISTLKPYFRHQAIGSLIKDISTEEYIKVYSGMMRYNSEQITMLLNCIFIRGNEKLGYEPLSGVMKGDDCDLQQGEIVDHLKIKYLEKIIELAIDNNIPLAFVASPWYGVKESNIFEPVKAICNEKGIPFFDYYSDPLFQSKRLFKDAAHLNGEGAQLFSCVVLNQIKKILY